MRNAPHSAVNLKKKKKGCWDLILHAIILSRFYGKSRNVDVGALYKCQICSKPIAVRTYDSNVVENRVERVQ